MLLQFAQVLTILNMTHYFLHPNEADNLTNFLAFYLIESMIENANHTKENMSAHG